MHDDNHKFIVDRQNYIYTWYMNDSTTCKVLSYILSTINKYIFEDFLQINSENHQTIIEILEENQKKLRYLLDF